MIKSVQKRNGDIVDFDQSKITVAVIKAMRSLGEDQIDEESAGKITRKVLNKLKKQSGEVPTVDEVHVLVENSIMDMKMYELAREYITYRDKHKPDVFRKRTNIKPYEYPELISYVDAIRHSYWIHTEFNFEPDIQDMKVNLAPHEVSAITRAMLAISQIESAVKTFWGDIHKKMPKPEIAKVGATFSESEVRHEDTYSHLIEIMGLNDEFEKIKEVPAMRKRIGYLEKVNENAKSPDPRDYFETIILFSMFIENVSLFTQFLIIMSFNKHRNMLKGMSNGIEATSKEENIHAMFGFDIVNIIKEENPHWWTEELQDYIKQITRDAFNAELEVVNWIYEEGDIDIIPRAVSVEYIKKRLNDSLKAIGIDPIFELEEGLVSQAEWFEDEILVDKSTDFFNKRVTNYQKRQETFSPDELF